LALEKGVFIELLICTCSK